MTALCPYEVTYKHLSGSSRFLEWALPLGAATSCQKESGILKTPPIALQKLGTWLFVGDFCRNTMVVNGAGLRMSLVRNTECEICLPHLSITTAEWI